MSTFLIAMVVFSIAVAGMSIGWLLAGRRMRGSCGGLAGFRDAEGNPICDACSNPSTDCAEFREKSAAPAD